MFFPGLKTVFRSEKSKQSVVRSKYSNFLVFRSKKSKK